MNIILLLIASALHFDVQSDGDNAFDDKSLWIFVLTHALCSCYLFRYCNSHLQVLGIVPKKNRRKKPGEGVECEANSSSSTTECKARTDVLATPASTNMSSIPTLFPYRSKKPKNQPPKKNYANSPAIEELRESRRKWQKDRADLFKIYGKDFLQKFCVFVLLIEA